MQSFPSSHHTPTERSKTENIYQIECKTAPQLYCVPGKLLQFINMVQCLTMSDLTVLPGICINREAIQPNISHSSNVTVLCE